MGRVGLTWFGLGLVLSACHSLSAPARVPVLVLHQESYCRFAQPTLLELRNPDDARGFWRETLGGRGYPGPVSADFEGRLVLLVALGRKPSGGYTLEVGDAAELQHDLLDLPVREHPPRKDSVQTGRMTSPCVLLSLPASEARRIRALDLELQR